MADKKMVMPEEPVVMSVDTPALFLIEDLAKKFKVPNHRLVSTKVFMRWGSGKEVSEAVFLQAIQDCAMQRLGQR